MDLFITHLETLAGCPWQLFLGRLLRLEPTPDPLAALPGADPLLLGNTVHATLERIVREAGEMPILVPWPAAADLDRMLIEEAGKLLAAEGIGMPGLARALAERARPLVEAAGAADWAGGVALPVLRAETQEKVAVHDAAGRLLPLRFRADRVEQVTLGPGGAIRFTDYKTGRPLSRSVKPDVRRRHFLERVRAGSHLQAMAYLLAAGGEPAVGRYLYLRPDLPADEREYAVTSDDRDFAAAFDRAVRAVLAAWDAGSFFPRVVDPAGRNEPGRCGYCAVAEACLRGDSGARNRLFEWTARAERGARTESRTDTGLDAAGEALLGVWRLPAKEKSSGAENGGEAEP